jgi:hypothetical protein
MSWEENRSGAAAFARSDRDETWLGAIARNQGEQTVTTRGRRGVSRAYIASRT